MIYDFMGFQLTSNLDCKLKADILTLELIENKESLIVEMGNFFLLYLRVNDEDQLEVKNKYFSVNFGKN